MRLVFVSPTSACFELENDSVYFAPHKYNVYLNKELVLEDKKTNVFSIYNLNPGTTYEVEVNQDKLVFETSKINKTIHIYGSDHQGNNVTKQIQDIIDKAEENDLIVFEGGKYNCVNLKLKSNLNVEFKKNAVLSGSFIPEDYEEIEGEEIIDGKLIERGTWEGNPRKMKLALINVIDCENVKIYGEGVIDMNAQYGVWFIDEKNLPYVRPHTIFMNQSKNVFVQGLKLYNAAQWTIHPYFCDNIGFYDLYLFNEPNHPNTDGINPQCCDGCEIIGVEFSVGDDCIAIKSGKIYIAQHAKKTCSNILIRNCYMNRGHGAIVLGSENACGMKNLTIKQCYFNKTDRGLRIKTRRGRGKDAIIDGIKFENIVMNEVLTPFVLNMFYFCDPDGHSEYVWSKEKLPVDERTPYIGEMIFENIFCNNSEWCAGYFYALPEKRAKSIVLKNIEVSFKRHASSGKPAMMENAELLSKKGFVFNNIESVYMENVKIIGQEGEFYTCQNVDKLDVR